MIENKDKNFDDLDAGYPKPFATIDVVILTLRDGELYVLLMQRKNEPFKENWALPGGYIHPQEDLNLDAAALRILKSKTGITPPYIEQLGSFGDNERDPRGWTATFTYFALVSSETMLLKEGGNAAAVNWFKIDNQEQMTNLAFDHSQIINCAVKRLRAKVEYTTLPVHLLSEKFTLPDLQEVYEQILGRKIDKSAFRKRIAELDFVEPIDGEKRSASNRPAQLYRLKDGFSTIFFNRTI
ncbi:MAG: NUDIX domain-containing protein [Alphaproteobacteria bacterium]